MENDIVGLIILWVVIGLVVGGGVSWLCYYLWGRNKWNFPKGCDVVKGEYNGVTCWLVYDKSIKWTGYSKTEVAERCALGGWALGQVVTGYYPSEFCVWVLPSSEYAKRVDVDGFKSNGRLLELHTKAGSRYIPMAACRFEVFETTITGGSLVVHEMLHDVLREGDAGRDGNAAHNLPGVWGMNGIEGKAFKVFEDELKFK